MRRLVLLQRVKPEIKDVIEKLNLFRPPLRPRFRSNPLSSFLPTSWAWHLQVIAGEGTASKARIPGHGIQDRPDTLPFTVSKETKDRKLGIGFETDGASLPFPPPRSPPGFTATNTSD